MQKILITGANGFVGYYLTSLLLSRGHIVIATGKGPGRLPFKDAHFSYESLDFTLKDAVEDLVGKHKPDVIVHSGALSRPDECEQNREAAFLTNVTGTLHMVEAAKAINSFFVFLSTDFVFDGERGMYREEDERGPVNYYGQTKMLAEDEVALYKGPWAIVRTVLVYGKPVLSRGNILTNVAASLKKGQPLKIFSDQVRTPTYVEDLATGIVSIIERKATGIFHISGEDVQTPYGMAMAVAEHLQLDASLITEVHEKDFDQPARRPPKTGFDISRAKNELGYTPLSFREGLRKTFEAWEG